MENRDMKILLLALTTILCWHLLERVSYAYPTAVERALDKAGENRAELEKVLGHYSQETEPLKLQAAYFLVENMKGHNYYVYGLYDANEVEVDLDILAYHDYKSLLEAMDKIEAQRGRLKYKGKRTVEDLETITADYLIENIDLAFQGWRSKPWANHISFEHFCNFILPYRVTNEPAERWRQYFLRRYEGIEKKMKNPEDPVEAACIINDDLKSWFKFDSRFYKHPTDQGLSEMLKNRKGRCEDMANLTIYAMRANGLAVTYDFTPYWANTGNNHAWNVILDREGRAVPFMGCEANPGKYRLANRLAKVRRVLYSQQNEKEGLGKDCEKNLPSRFKAVKKKRHVDVTREYIPVCDVTVRLEKDVPEGTCYAYLCVFNSGEWKAVQWGKIKDQQVTFKDMGKKIAYLPMYYVDEKFVSAGAPFILDENANIRILDAQEGKNTDITISWTTKRAPARDTDTIAKIFLESDRKYELFYWNDGWTSLGEKTVNNGNLRFDKVPQGCLYRIVGEGSRKDERIFTIEEGVQVWW